MTSHRFANGALGALCGGVYAVGLFTLGALSIGIEYGTYLPLKVFGAPASLVDPSLTAWGVFVVWPIVGFLLAACRGRRIPVFALAIHAAGVAVILSWGTPFESASELWEQFGRVRRHVETSVRTGFAIYATGQVIAWGLLLVPRGGEDEGLRG